MMNGFLKKLLFFPQKSLFFVVNRIILKMQNVDYGHKLKINGFLFVRNHGRITIGDNCTINSSFSSNPVGGPYKTSIAVDTNATLTIGNNVGISGTAIMCNKQISIEDNVMIGSGCCIYDSDFHSIQYKARISSKDTGFEKRAVKIREGAFIGARAIVLKGVEIGKHSVVGAGSVVTKSIPMNEIWAGNPSRKMKEISEK